MIENYSFLNMFSGIVLYQIIMLDLVKIVLPDTITLLKDSVFQNCQKLRDIHIPTALKTMEHNVFTGCAERAYIDAIHDYPTYLFPMARGDLEYIHDGSSLSTFYECKAHIGFADDGETDFTDP